MADNELFVPKVWAEKVAAEMAKKIDADILSSLMGQKEDCLAELIEPTKEWEDLYTTLGLVVGNSPLQSRVDFDEAVRLVGSTYAARYGRAPTREEIYARLTEFKNWRGGSAQSGDGGKTSTVRVRLRR